MTQPPQDNLLNTYKCCVIIPTYNNHNTLKTVIDEVLMYTKNIIIINDGSTDSTRKILDEYTTLEQIHLEKNKGKGNALRLGFKKALELGYQYAITIDSDGQHFPEDIPVFIEALAKESNKKVLLIGARNMNQDSIPKKSSFGNKFSNFWFWVETGYKLQDTQSGFRLYPIQEMKNLSFKTTKFEFEIEVIVKSAWNDIIVKNIPIKIHYDQENRVSHFRPFKDFTRISILNTWLVIVTFFYIKPRNLIRSIKKKGVKTFIKEEILGSNDTPKKKALSIALGLFIGLSPAWGFHTILVLSLAVAFKLNKAIAFGFSNISLPIFIPFIIYASSKIGQCILGTEIPFTIEEFTTSFEVIKHLKTYLVGSIILAISMAISVGFLSYYILNAVKKKGI